MLSSSVSVRQFGLKQRSSGLEITEKWIAIFRVAASAFLFVRCSDAGKMWCVEYIIFLFRRLYPNVRGNLW